MEGLDVMRRALAAAGAGNGARYRLLCRQGRVLCGLPEDRAVALRTLELYQPQRPLARAVSVMARMAEGSGLGRIAMKSWALSQSVEGSEIVGALVGSAGHLCERAVTVKHGADGWQVTKHGFGRAAAGILGAEANMLQQLEGREQVPRLLGFASDDESASLTMAWKGGQPWRKEDLGPLIDLLDSWVDVAEQEPLSHFEEWKAMLKGMDALPGVGGVVENLGGLRVARSVRHGDLTRPNLRLAGGRSLVVHDWERGSMHGVAGLDLAHYLTQDLSFRKKIAPAMLVETVHRQLKGGQVSPYLSRVGWHGKEEFLMLATWSFNCGSMYLDQKSLLTAWMARFA